MKKTIFILTILLIINLIPFSYCENSEINYSINSQDIQAEAALLMEKSTGQILFQKNIHKRLYPASTTKLLTALIIIENSDLNETVIIDEKSPFTKGSRIYVEPGEELTIEQLLNALLIESANDAAKALAIHHSGSVEDFAKEMNKKAKSLGCLNSNFVNPNGLHNKNHYTTAYDLGLISKAAYDNEIIREICSKTTYTILPTNKKDETRYLKTSNKFLFSENKNYLIPYHGKDIFVKYNIINGLKTGYTDEAGNCLVSSAASQNKELISIVLKSAGRNLYLDSRKLIDYGLYELKEKKFYEKNDIVKEIQLNNFKKSKINIIGSSDIKVFLPKNYDLSQLSTEILIDDIKLPISKNDVLGSFNIIYNDQLISSIDLYSNINVDNTILLKKKTHYFQKEKDKLTPKKIISIILKILISFIIWRSIITFFRKLKKTALTN